jgi:uncharacterized protein with HEPN domain
MKYLRTESRFMDNRKNDLYYTQKITADLAFIVAHTENLSKEEFDRDEVLIDSVMFRLIQISENSDRLTDDFKQRHSHIPWHAIKGLRNRIVHEYGNVDFTIVYDTVKRDIPELLGIFASQM